MYPSGSGKLQRWPLHRLRFSYVARQRAWNAPELPAVTPTDTSPRPGARYVINDGTGELFRKMKELRGYSGVVRGTVESPLNVYEMTNARKRGGDL